MRRRRRGIFVMDAIVGLAIIAAVATAIAVALTQYRKAEQRLSDTRAAVRLCECVMAELSGGSVPVGNGRATWKRLSTEQAPPGYAWIEVVAIHGDGRASVTGLVPVSSVEDTP